LIKSLLLSFAVVQALLDAEGGTDAESVGKPLSTLFFASERLKRLSFVLD
jgi:hypothetical protein